MIIHLSKTEYIKYTADKHEVTFECDPHRFHLWRSMIRYRYFGFGLGHEWRDLHWSDWLYDQEKRCNLPIQPTLQYQDTFPEITVHSYPNDLAMTTCRLIKGSGKNSKKLVINMYPTTSNFLIQGKATGMWIVQEFQNYIEAVNLLEKHEYNLSGQNSQYTKINLPKELCNKIKPQFIKEITYPVPENDKLTTMDNEQTTIEIAAFTTSTDIMSEQCSNSTDTGNYNLSDKVKPSKSTDLLDVSDETLTNISNVSSMQTSTPNILNFSIDKDILNELEKEWNISEVDDEVSITKNTSDVGHTNETSLETLQKNTEIHDYVFLENNDVVASDYRPSDSSSHIDLDFLQISETVFVGNPESLQTDLIVFDPILSELDRDNAESTKRKNTDNENMYLQIKPSVLNTNSQIHKSSTDSNKPTKKLVKETFIQADIKPINPKTKEKAMNTIPDTNGQVVLELFETIKVLQNQIISLKREIQCLKTEQIVNSALQKENFEQIKTDIAQIKNSQLTTETITKDIQAQGAIHTGELYQEIANIKEMCTKSFKQNITINEKVNKTIDKEHSEHDLKQKTKEDPNTTPDLGNKYIEASYEERSQSNYLKIPKHSKSILIGDSNLKNVIKHKLDKSGETEIRSYRGHSSVNIKQKLQNSKSTYHQIEKVSLCIGTVDVLQKYSCNEITNNYKSMLSEVEMTFPNAKICIISIPPTKDGKTNLFIKRVNMNLQKLQTDKISYKHSDVLWAHVNDASGLPDREILYDDIHLSNRGLGLHLRSVLSYLFPTNRETKFIQHKITVESEKDIQKKLSHTNKTQVDNKKHQHDRLDISYRDIVANHLTIETDETKSNIEHQPHYMHKNTTGINNSSTLPKTKMFSREHHATMNCTAFGNDNSSNSNQNSQTYDNTDSYKLSNEFEKRFKMLETLIQESQQKTNMLTQYMIPYHMLLQSNNTLKV